MSGNEYRVSNTIIKGAYESERILNEYVNLWKDDGYKLITMSSNRERGRTIFTFVWQR